MLKRHYLKYLPLVIAAAGIATFVGTRSFADGHAMGSDGGHGHWGAGYGRGPWGGPTGMTGPDASNDPRRQWVADMHRSLHEAETKSTEPTNSTPLTTPPTAG